MLYEVEIIPAPEKAGFPINDLFAAVIHARDFWQVVQGDITLADTRIMIIPKTAGPGIKGRQGDQVFVPGGIAIGTHGKKIGAGIAEC